MCPTNTDATICGQRTTHLEMPRSRFQWGAHCTREIYRHLVRADVQPGVAAARASLPALLPRLHIRQSHLSNHSLRVSDRLVRAIGARGASLRSMDVITELDGQATYPVWAAAWLSPLWSPIPAVVGGNGREPFLRTTALRILQDPGVLRGVDDAADREKIANATRHLGIPAEAQARGLRNPEHPSRSQRADIQARQNPNGSDGGRGTGSLGDDDEALATGHGDVYDTVSQAPERGGRQSGSLQGRDHLRGSAGEAAETVAASQVGVRLQSQNYGYDEDLASTREGHHNPSAFAHTSNSDRVGPDLALQTETRQRHGLASYCRDEDGERHNEAPRTPERSGVLESQHEPGGPASVRSQAHGTYGALPLSPPDLETPTQIQSEHRGDPLAFRAGTATSSLFAGLCTATITSLPAAFELDAFSPNASAAALSGGCDRQLGLLAHEFYELEAEGGSGSPGDQAPAKDDPAAARTGETQPHSIGGITPTGRGDDCNETGDAAAAEQGPLAGEQRSAQLPPQNHNTQTPEVPVVPRRGRKPPPKALVLEPHKTGTMAVSASKADEADDDGECGLSRWIPSQKQWKLYESQRRVQLALVYELRHYGWKGNMDECVRLYGRLADLYEAMRHSCVRWELLD